MRRHDAIPVDEIIARILIERQLVEEHQRARHNQQCGDDRGRVSRPVVSQGKHSARCALSAIEGCSRRARSALHQLPHLRHVRDVAARARRRCSSAQPWRWKTRALRRSASAATQNNRRPRETRLPRRWYRYSSPRIRASSETALRHMPEPRARPASSRQRACRFAR